MRKRSRKGAEGKGATRKTAGGLPFLVGILLIICIGLLLFLRMDSVLLITDPVWRDTELGDTGLLFGRTPITSLIKGAQVDLNDNKGFLPRLRLSLSNRRVFLKVKTVEMGPHTGGDVDEGPERDSPERDSPERNSEERAKRTEKKSVPEAIYSTIRNSDSTMIILSPVLSEYSYPLSEAFPERSFLALGPEYLDEKNSFEGTLSEVSPVDSPGSERSQSEKKHLFVTRTDLAPAMMSAGEVSADFVLRQLPDRTLDRSTGVTEGAVQNVNDQNVNDQAKGRITLYLVYSSYPSGFPAYTDTSSNPPQPENTADRYADAFAEGWRQWWRQELKKHIEEDGTALEYEIKLLPLDEKDKEVETELRESSVGKADFVLVWGEQSAEVLRRLDEWGVPSCARGPYAAEAYPGTVQVEIVYKWKGAIERGVEMMRNDSSVNRKIKLKGKIERQ